MCLVQYNHPSPSEREHKTACQTLKEKQLIRFSQPQQLYLHDVLAIDPVWHECHWPSVAMLISGASNTGWLHNDIIDNASCHHEVGQQDKYVMLLYIRVFVVLSRQHCRKESQKLDINLDSAVLWECH